ncbi:hypothetical protein [Asanoa hainanensis]|nr:hypothetical protein [Asanoa hainanensis]
MQLDTNLVLYKGSPSHNTAKVCWASNTAGRGWNSTYAIYQSDGNFVVYTFSGVPIWDSNSVGIGGTTVDINYLGQWHVGYKQMTFGTC